MKRIIFVICAVLLSAQLSAAKSISATAGLRHFGPVTKEVSDNIRTASVASFRKEIFVWLKDNIKVELDTVNTVKSYSLDKLTARALLSAEEKTFTRGRTLNISFTIGEKEMREALNEHDNYYGVFVKQHWENYVKEIESDKNAALSNAVKALCAAALQIGVNNSEPAIDTLRRTVQGLFNKIEVKSDVMIIEGRPGSNPVKFPTAKFTFDAEPLKDFHITAFIQNGRELVRMTTSEDGTLALDDHIIPFVHNGSMLSLVPDARSYMDDVSFFVKFRDLGIRLNRGQELSFVYKVPTLNAVLNFKAHSPDNSINVTREFSADAHVRRFLKDSCNIAIVSSGAKSDLTIDINIEFVRKLYEDVGDESILMKGKATLKGGPVNKTGETVFEKRREMGTAIEMGPYFHEATVALRNLIRKALYKE